MASSSSTSGPARGPSAGVRRSSAVSTASTASLWDASKPIKIYLMQADNLYHQFKVYHSEGKLKNALRIGTQFEGLVKDTLPTHSEYRLPTYSRRVALLNEKQVEIANLLELIRPVLRKRRESTRSPSTASAFAASLAPSHIKANDAIAVSDTEDQDDEEDDNTDTELSTVRTLTTSRSKEAMERWQRSLSRSPPGPPALSPLDQPPLPTPSSAAAGKKSPVGSPGTLGVDALLSARRPAKSTGDLSPKQAPPTLQKPVVPHVPTSSKPKIPSKPSQLQGIPATVLRRRASVTKDASPKVSPTVSPRTSISRDTAKPPSPRLWGAGQGSRSSSPDASLGAPPRMTLKAGTRLSVSSSVEPSLPSKPATPPKDADTSRDAANVSINSSVFKGASFAQKADTSATTAGLNSNIFKDASFAAHSQSHVRTGSTSSGVSNVSDIVNRLNLSADGTPAAPSKEVKTKLSTTGIANSIRRPASTASSASPSASPMRTPLAPTSPPIEPPNLSPVSDSHEDVDQFLSRFPDIEKETDDDVFESAGQARMRKAKSFASMGSPSPANRTPADAEPTPPPRTSMGSGSRPVADRTTGASDSSGTSFFTARTSQPQPAPMRGRTSTPGPAPAEPEAPPKPPSDRYAHLQVVKATAVVEPDDENDGSAQAGRQHGSAPPPNARPDFINPDVLRQWQHMQQQEQFRQQQQAAYAQAQAQAYAQAQAQAQAHAQAQAQAQVQAQAQAQYEAYVAQGNLRRQQEAQRQQQQQQHQAKSSAYPGAVYGQASQTPSYANQENRPPSNYPANGAQHQHHHHHHHSHHQHQAPKPHPAHEPRPRARLESGEKLRWLILPTSLVPSFLSLASPNTNRNLETCGILCGTLSHSVLRVTTVIIPEQSATPDSCTTDNEDDVYEYQSKRDLMTLGWIHTHPSQTCFMSSVDLHTHCSYQLMLKEAIAVVCAPKFHPNVGVFRLTDPPGLQRVTKCTRSGTFHPHDDDHLLYRDISTNAHVIPDFESKVQVVDLRRGKKR